MIGAVGALGASAFNAIGGFDGIKGLFGGGSDEPARQRFASCPGQPTAEVTAFLRNASEADFLRLKTEWDRVDWNDSSPQARYQSNLTRNADPFVVAQGLVGGDDCRVGTSASVQRLSSVASSLGLYPGGAPVASGSPPSGLERLGNALGTIAGNLGQAATNTLEGAVAGATAASSGAAQGSSLSLSNPLVLIALGAAVILLLRK